MTDMPRTPRLYLARRRRGGHTVVTAVGTIADTTVIQLRTMLLQALARGERSLVLDLAGVDRIDDAGLDALRRTAARTHLLGGQLRLVAPTPSVAECLHAGDLRRHVAVDATLARALDALAAASLPRLADPPADGRAELPLDAGAADLLDRHTPVPVDDQDRSTGT